MEGLPSGYLVVLARIKPDIRFFALDQTLQRQSEESERRAATRSRKPPRSCTRCTGSRRAAAACWSNPAHGQETTLTAPNWPSRGHCKDHSVAKAPADPWQADPPERLQGLAPSMTAASSASVPWACVGGISSRATKGKVTNMVASTRPGTANTSLIRARRARGRTSPGREEQDVNEAGDAPARPEGQVDQSEEQALAAELETRDRPGRADAEDEVGRHCDRGDQQRQPDHRKRHQFGDCREIGVHALAQRFMEHRGEGDDQQRGEQEQRDSDQQPPEAGAGRLFGRKRQRDVW